MPEISRCFRAMTFPLELAKLVPGKSATPHGGFFFFAGLSFRLAVCLRLVGLHRKSQKSTPNSSFTLYHLGRTFLCWGGCYSFFSITVWPSASDFSVVYFLL